MQPRFILSAAWNMVTGLRSRERSLQTAEICRASVPVFVVGACVSAREHQPTSAQNSDLEVGSSASAAGSLSILSRAAYQQGALVNSGNGVFCARGEVRTAGGVIGNKSLQAGVARMPRASRVLSGCLNFNGVGISMDLEWLVLLDGHTKPGAETIKCSRFEVCTADTLVRRP